MGALIFVLFVLWLLGLLGHVAGGFIHLLLVIALLVFIYNMLVERR